MAPGNGNGSRQWRRCAQESRVSGAKLRRLQLRVGAAGWLDGQARVSSVSLSAHKDHGRSRSEVGSYSHLRSARGDGAYGNPWDLPATMCHKYVPCSDTGLCMLVTCAENCRT